jgi:hypothetical protein
LKFEIKNLESTNGRIRLYPHGEQQGERCASLFFGRQSRVLNITMAVAGEVAVMRERLDTIERLLAAKGILSNAEIEAYIPTDSEAEERQKLHAEYISRILRIVQQEVEALQQAPENNLPMEEVAEILSRT